MNIVARPQFLAKVDGYIRVDKINQGESLWSACRLRLLLDCTH